MNEFFGGVVYVGIDIDKYCYFIGELFLFFVLILLLLIYCWVYVFLYILVNLIILCYCLKLEKINLVFLKSFFCSLRKG